MTDDQATPWWEPDTSPTTPPAAPPSVAPPPPPPMPPSSSVAADSPGIPPTQRRWLIATACFTAVALVAALLIWFARDDGTPAAVPPSSTTTTTTTSSTTTSIPTDSVLDIGFGVSAVVPPGALPDGASIIARRSNGSLDAVLSDPDIESLTPVLDIHASASLAGPVTLRIPRPAPNGDSSSPLDAVMVFHERADGQIEVLDAVPSADGHYLETVTSSFSNFLWFRFKQSAVGQAINSLVSTLTGGIASAVLDPNCAAPRSDITAEVTATNDGGPLDWCATTRADGSIEVQATNTRRYPVAIVLKSNTTVDDAPSGSLVVWLRSKLPDTDAVLSAGERVSVRVPNGMVGGFVAEFDGLANTLFTLQLVIDLIFFFVGKIPGITSPTPEKVLPVIEASGCLTDLVLSAEFSAGYLAKLVTACFNSNVLKAIVPSVAAILLAPVITVLSTGAFFFTQGQSLRDLLSNGSMSTFTIGARTGTTNAPATTLAPGGSSSGGGWPTGRNDGTPAYWAWLGASFILPNWTSCSENYCIAGTSDTVYATALKPLRDIGSVPISTDPHEALRQLPEADRIALLTPG